MMKRLVLVIDTQADFMNAEGALAVNEADTLIAPLNDYLHGLRADDVAGVLFTFDTHDAALYPSSPEAALFPPHCLRGTDGWANVLDSAMVDPAIPIWRLEKGVFDMWAEPGLVVERITDRTTIDREAFFAQQRAAGVEAATVVGVAADYCVRWAVTGLVARGFMVEVPPALTRGIERSIAQVLAEDFAGAPVRLTPPRA